jgi:hypothetical protein
MKFTNFIQLALLGSVIMFTAPSCVKEGPMGLQGEPGTDGTAGTDANETCKMCHKASSVDLIAAQYEFSKHSYGEAAFEEAGNTGCTPCHTQEAFKYVVKNNVPATFVADPAKPGKFMNSYATVSSAAYGEIGCSTCHSSLHTTYETSDLAFTTTAAVPMTMWGGNKTIDLKQDGGVSNLCVKCHQPRPQTNLQTGNVQDYASLIAKPKDLAYDAENDKATTNIVRPSYRMHVHYGSVGAIFAGVGGVEFGTGYTSSKHTTVASCVDCHMADMNGRAGGHTFKVRNSADETGLTASTAWNFNGCNVAGCHSENPISAATSSKYWKQTRDEVKTLLESLAAKLTVGGIDILNRNNDVKTNIWAGLTKNNYDGYLNVYDPINNPNFAASNPGGTFQNPAPSNSWTPEQKALNLTFPKLSLTNAQYGALLNFQLCLREYSLGIHNTAYTKTLLTNSIAALN